MPEYYAMYQRDPDYLGALCVTYLSGWYSDLFSVLVQFSSPCRYTYGCPPPFLSPFPTTAQRTMFDGQLGRLMQILKDTGVYGNTVVFYTADNGPHQGAERTDIHWSTNFLRQCKVGHLFYFLLVVSPSLTRSLPMYICILSSRTIHTRGANPFGRRNVRTQCSGKEICDILPNRMLLLSCEG
jgi:hypothetical protein